MKEEDLASKVVQWLQDQHYEVYQEVQVNGGRVCDIVARMDGRIWMIETKISMSLAVMEQAYRWKPYSHWVSVGVPDNSGHGFAEQVCRSFGIGVIRVSMRDISYGAADVHEDVPASINRKANIKTVYLSEEHKTFAKAGTAKGQHWSEYKQTCREINHYVRDNPGCSLKELIDNIEHHYGSSSGARAWISHWARAGKVKGIRCERDGKWLRFYKKG
jgi:hypothetical protein